MLVRSPPPRARRAPLPGLYLLTASKPLSTGVGSSLPSLVSCKALMPMPCLTVSSLSSTTLVVKQSQFHCRIVRRCMSCSGISVLWSTAAGLLVALCTDAQIWQVHASAAINLCCASWVFLAHFTWNYCRHVKQTRGLRTWARHLLHSGHFLTVVQRGVSAGVAGSVFGWSVEWRCMGIKICWGMREQCWLLTLMFIWQ